LAENFEEEKVGEEKHGFNIALESNNRIYDDH
jgi:hypothetical protein